MPAPASAPVLWPDNLCASGYFYGWVAPAICVAGVLQVDSIDDARIELDRRLAHASSYGELAQMFDALPAVLGRCAFDGAEPRLEFHQPDYHLHHVVHFRRPDLKRMQLYALHNQLSLFTRHEDLVAKQFNPSAIWNADCSLVPPVKAFVFNQSTIDQMNYGQVYEHESHAGGSRRRAALNQARQIGSKLSETSIDWWPSTLTSAVPQFGSSSFQQLSIRAAQLVSLLGRVPVVNAMPTVKDISEYVTFYNYVWLILNDVIIGSAIGSVICEQSEFISSTLDYCVRRLLISDLQKALVWLNNWPAGLKLNSELSQFYCHLLLGAVVGWNKMLETFFLPYLTTLVYAVGVVGTCGITMSLCVVSDMLLITTAHTYVCYHLSRAVYQRQLGICGSLWSLFRGKRYNILRRRVDSWSYDVDQLLFGTILFTLIAFVFPTTITYYLLFASMHVATLCVSAVIETVLFLVNHFPLFAILLRLKDPERLPSGIVLKCTTGSIRIENKPLSLAAIFSHYQAFHTSLSVKFHPLRLLSAILRGNIL